MEVDEQLDLEEKQEEVDPIVQADRLKELGNAEFKAGRYEDAITFYNKAIGAHTLWHTHMIVFTYKSHRIEINGSNILDESSSMLHGSEKIQSGPRRLPKCLIIANRPTRPEDSRPPCKVSSGIRITRTGIVSSTASSHYGSDERRGQEG